MSERPRRTRGPITQLADWVKADPSVRLLKAAMVALAIYVGSFVASFGLDGRLMTTWQIRALQFIYAPIIWVGQKLPD